MPAPPLIHVVGVRKSCSTAGEVWVGGVPVHRLDENRLATWRGRRLSIVYQSFHLMPTLPLVDNVLLPIDLCGDYHPRRSRERALGLLALVGLEADAHTAAFANLRRAAVLKNP